MNENIRKMMKKPFDVNPAIWLWLMIDANSYLKHQFSKFIVVAKIECVMVFYST